MGPMVERGGDALASVKRRRERREEEERAALSYESRRGEEEGEGGRGGAGEEEVIGLGWLYFGARCEPTVSRAYAYPSIYTPPTHV